MKIYKPEPADLIRLQIMKQGHDVEYMTLCECTADQVKKHIQKLLAKKVSLFPEGKRTTIHVREAKGAKNGKSKSFHFYGPDPKEVFDLITESLK